MELYRRVTDELVLIRSEGKHPSVILLGLNEKYELMQSVEWIMPHQWIHFGNCDTLFGCLVRYEEVPSKMEILSEEDIDNFAYIKWVKWLKDNQKQK